MPTYEYKCTNCEQEMDIVQKMSDPKLVTCPHCKKDSLSKMISAPNFHLKGSGWYATDFKTPKNKDNQSKDSNASNVIVDTTKITDTSKEKEKTKE